MAARNRCISCHAQVDHRNESICCSISAEGGSDFHGRLASSDLSATPSGSELSGTLRTGSQLMGVRQTGRLYRVALLEVEHLLGAHRPRHCMDRLQRIVWQQPTVSRVRLAIAAASLSFVWEAGQH